MRDAPKCAHATASPSELSLSTTQWGRGLG